MKRTATAAIALVAAASLVLAGSAVAGSKTYRQTGQIVGDNGSKVKLRVKVKNGDPQSIKGFKAKDVITRCDTKNGRKVKRYDYLSLDPITVQSDNEFNIVLTDSSIGLKITLAGKVKKHGKNVVGKIKTNRFEDGGKVCKAPKQKFKTAA